MIIFPSSVNVITQAKQSRVFYPHEMEIPSFLRLLHSVFYNKNALKKPSYYSTRKYRKTVIKRKVRKCYIVTHMCGNKAVILPHNCSNIVKSGENVNTLPHI